MTTTASQVWNVMTESFSPLAVKGILFISSPAMVEGDRAGHFGSSGSIRFPI